MRIPLKRVNCWVVLATLLLSLTNIPEVVADKKHGKSGGKGHFHVGLTPGGISYGYHSRGFSIDVAPSNNFGYGYGYGYPTYDYFPARGAGFYDRPYGAPPYYEQFDYGYSPVPPVEYIAPLPSAVQVAPVQAAPLTVAPLPASPDTIQILPNAKRLNSTVVPTNPKAAVFQNDAERAFLLGQHQDALRSNGHAILEDGNNGKLLLFQSQVQFALGDYVGAVAAIENAIELTPASERGFVVESYSRLYRGRSYVEQVDRLVQHCANHPKSEHGVLLLAYHYMHLGHENAAQGLLQSYRGMSDRRTALADYLGSSLESQMDVPSRPTPASVIPSPDDDSLR